MKTVKLLIFIIAASLILSSCTNPTTDSIEKIVPPQNQIMPIEGTWEISKVLVSMASDEDEEEEEWVGQRVQFSDIYVSIGESILESPQYQMKRVSTESYLLFNSKSLPSDFVFPNNEIEVITVVDQDRFFCEVLIIQEDEIILKIQSNTFYLSKVSKEVEEYTLSGTLGTDNADTSIAIDKEGLIKTGVLLGIRSKIDGGESEEGYTYKTLWISSANKELNPILEIENIIFPRRSGFWKIEVKQASEGLRTQEYIAANNVLMEENKVEIQLKSKIMQSEGLFIAEEENQLELDFSRWEDRTGEIKRKINYIGNDYISTESYGKGGYILGDQSWEKSKLGLIPIDSLPNGRGIQISDILEDNGVAAMKSAWEKSINSLGIDSPSILYREEMLDNFGLERKLGHWFLEGRINYIRDKEFKVADYNISLIPPSKVVVYDTLFVPWTNIKDRVPMAIDAYTSPNKDIAIVLTRKELLIYDIHGNDLGSYPKERIKVKEGDTIIMAEWATGQYVDSWKDVLQKSGGQLLGE